MTLRISEIAEKRGTTLRVDGRLLGNAVAELARASANAAPPLTLDLSGLLFADSEGVGALQQLRAHGTTLRNVPPYVSLLLEMEVTRHHSRNADAQRAVPPKQID